MSIKAILTNRELKNKVTGIDLFVSDYQEIPHRIKNTYLYHVIVVTNLFYYKSKEHRESDVVQFMVSKSFDEFQDLYEKLYKRFPSVNFPSLPSKNILASASSVTTERLKCMDQVMKLVASTLKLASSPMVISFLRGDPTAPKKDEQQEIQEETIEENESSAIFTEPDDEDLFTNSPGAKKDDLFDSPETSQEKSEKSIFEDESSHEVDGNLFDANPVKSLYEKSYEVQDEDDLLNVSDDLDELLMLSRNSENKSSIKVERRSSKPQVASTSGITDLNAELDETGTDDMFKQARALSIRKSRSDSSSISDIFEKKTSLLFDGDEDDDLFSSSLNSNLKKGVDIMGEDDITAYILQQEKPDKNVSLNL